DADMRGTVERRPRCECVDGDAVELAAEFFLDQCQHLVEAQPVDDVFEPRFAAVGPIAMVDEYAHDSVRHFGRVGRLNNHAGLAREVLFSAHAPAPTPT